MSITVRPPALRRSWLFHPGVPAPGTDHPIDCAADALILCLEDGTPPHLRPRAREGIRDFVERARRAGKVACVRINPLEMDGEDDLRAVLPAAPTAILLPKTESAQQVRALAARIEAGASTPIEIVPNIETALGLVRTLDIATAHPWVSACLLASEDLTTSLGAERGRDGVELAYARGRFLVECRAAGVVAIDCPYTFSDAAGVEAETRHARRLGYGAKSTVDASHAGVINDLLTPSAADVDRARRIVAEFDRAYAAGERAQVDGNYLEVPIYTNARRLLDRHALLEAAGR